MSVNNEINKTDKVILGVTEGARRATGVTPSI